MGFATKKYQQNGDVSAALYLVVHDGTVIFGPCSLEKALGISDFLNKQQNREHALKVLAEIQQQRNSKDAEYEIAAIESDVNISQPDDETIVGYAP